MSRTLHLSLRARPLLTQTTAFTHLLGGLGPRAFGPAVELEFPSPPINGVARCWDSSSISEVPYHCHMQGKQYKTPCHKKYLTKIPISEKPHKNTLENVLVPPCSILLGPLNCFIASDPWPAKQQLGRMLITLGVYYWGCEQNKECSTIK